jgi:hypothetical protein
LAPPLSGLRRLIQRLPGSSRAVDEKCDLCGEALYDEHPHLVNVESRRLLCACRACALLFTHEGAGKGKIRAVPERYRRIVDVALDDATWERLRIPVRTAFFFHSSPADRTVAFYPSPAGATESLLALDEWAELRAANPVLATLQPDVEALLVHGPREGGFDAYMVPINACYELVGRVRKSWRGFDGGPLAWDEIAGFFASLRARSEEVQAS